MSSSLVWISLTIAHEINCRIFLRPFPTTICFLDFLTETMAVSDARPRNALMARAIPSAESMSGRSGLISISIVSPSIFSTSAFRRNKVSSSFFGVSFFPISFIKLRKLHSTIILLTSRSIFVVTKSGLVNTIP